MWVVKTLGIIIKDKPMPLSQFQKEKSLKED